MDETPVTEASTNERVTRLPQPPPGMMRVTKTELVWPGKYNEDGTRKEVPRVSLPGFGKLDWPTSAVYFGPPLVTGFLSLVEETPKPLRQASDALRKVP